MDPARLAERLVDAAYDAWVEVRGRPGLADEVGMGADGTPTSRVDRFLDEAVLEAAADAGVSVLSEEAGFVDHGSEDLAVVDPLDGSRNAGRGIPIFCTSVAIGRRSLSGLSAGVVKNLVTEDVYRAAQGQGATLNGHDVARRPFDPEEILVAFMADHEEPRLMQKMQQKHMHMRDLGSAALEMCLVGTGALDAFDARSEHLRVIDIAAATLFVREAGGLVLHPRDEQDLDMAFDLAVRTGAVAVHSRGAWEALR